MIRVLLVVFSVVLGCPAFAADPATAIFGCQSRLVGSTGAAGIELIRDPAGETAPLYQVRYSENSVSDFKVLSGLTCVISTDSKLPFVAYCSNKKGTALEVLQRSEARLYTQGGRDVVRVVDQVVWQISGPGTTPFEFFTEKQFCHVNSV